MWYFCRTFKSQVSELCQIMSMLFWATYLCPCYNRHGWVHLQMSFRPDQASTVRSSTKDWLIWPLGMSVVEYFGLLVVDAQNSCSNLRESVFQKSWESILALETLSQVDGVWLPKFPFFFYSGKIKFYNGIFIEWGSYLTSQWLLPTEEFHAKSNHIQEDLKQGRGSSDVNSGCLCLKNH